MNKYIELGENAVLAIVAFAFFATVAVIAIPGCAECEKTNREQEKTRATAFQNGLHEVQNVGMQGTHFEKK